MKIRISSLAPLLFLSGCYLHRPPLEQGIDVPASYEHVQGTCSAPVIDQQWWTTFNDPQLNELVTKAYQQNYDIAIAAERIVELYDRYKIEFSRFFPQITLTSSVGASAFPTDLPIFVTLRDNPSAFYQAGFYTWWELDVWGKVRHSKNAAYADMQAQTELMHDTMITIASEVAKNYIALRALQVRAHVIEQSIEASRSLVTYAQDLFDSGLRDSSPLLQDQIDLVSAEQQLIRVRKELEQTQAQLALLVGEYPQEFVVQNMQQTVPFSSKQPCVGLPSDLLERRPDIRQAEEQLRAEYERLGAARTDWFPRFSLISTANSVANSLCQWFSKGSFLWFIGPSANWPLITFGKVRYTIKAQESRERQACLAYARAVTNALTEVEQYLIAYNRAQQQLALLESKRMNACTQAKLTDDRFQAGLDNKTEYLKAEKYRLTIEDEYVRAQQLVSTTLVGLYKALGGGW